MKHITVFINGKAFNFSSEMSLKDLLIYLDFNIHLIAVEYNQKVLTHNTFHEVFLNSKDSIEVITIVGGG